MPGHRVWANRNGRHVLGLVEDYGALRRQISEGRKLSRGMTAQLQECLHALRQLGSDNQVEVRGSATIHAARSFKFFFNKAYIHMSVRGRINKIFSFIDGFFVTVTEKSEGMTGCNSPS